MNQQSTVPGLAQVARGRSEITMAEFIASCKAKGEMLIPADDPIYAYTERAGIPDEFVEIAWLEFRERHLENTLKRYRDWRAAFRNSVRGNWFRLWRYADDGQCLLTVTGEQAARAHGKFGFEIRLNRQARSHADQRAFNASENAKAKEMLFGAAPRRQSRHSGFDQINYREGINEDGTF
jgi:hypothetical protein